MLICAQKSCFAQVLHIHKHRSTGYLSWIYINAGERTGRNMEYAMHRSVGLMPTCPGQKCCENLELNKTYKGMEIPQNVAYVTVFSSLMSCIASIIIVYIYVR